MQKIVDKYSEELGNKKNVVAVAIGQKWTNGKPTGKDAILVLVKEKIDISKLSKKDKVPKKLDGVITDVVGKVGEIQTFGYTSRYRPAPGGVSCGHHRITAGTLGAWFLNRKDEVVILSNNHVLSNENRARSGDPIWQPGRYDRGRGKDKIATLGQFEKLVRRNQRIYNRHIRKRVNYNLEDSATAKVTNHKLVDKKILKVGEVRGFNYNPQIGMPVKKTGRTTGHTKNKVIGTHATIFVQYDIGTLIFKDQILTHAMSRGGDSGSLLLDQHNRAVGLLFAGSNTITVHNHIKYPVRTYGLKILKEFPKVKTPPKRRRRRNSRLDQLRRRLAARRRRLALLRRRRRSRRRRRR
jgi:hypothetical protein